MASDLFRRFARHASDVTGSAWVFLLALLVVLVWAVTGPLFAFSDTWQLVINTGTTVVTFLVVFLIQNTQNRDTKAIHAKLDEIIIHEIGADNSVVLAEELTDQQLARLKAHYEKVGANGKGGPARSGTVGEKRRGRGGRGRGRTASKQ